MSIKDFVYNLINTKPYNYVPPCPRCKSKCTGYYIIGYHTSEYEREKVDRMKKGEIVRIPTMGIDHTNNLFCEKCGLEWMGNVEKRRLTREEMEEQRFLRGITDEYIYNRNITKENLINLKHDLDIQEKERDNELKSIKKEQKKKNKKAQEEIKIKK